MDFMGTADGIEFGLEQGVEQRVTRAEALVKGTDLQVVPTKLERVALRYWFLWIPFPTCALLLFSLFAGFIDQQPFPRPRLVFSYFTGWFLSDWLLHVGIAGFSLAALAFATWQRQIPSLLRCLISTGSLSSREAQADTVCTVNRQLAPFQALLNHPARFLVIGASVAFSTICAVTLDSQIVVDRINEPLAEVERLQFVVINYGMALVYGYAFGAGSWITGATAFFIRTLPVRFRVVVKPGHPDRCGGLGALGDFCLLMAAPALIGVALAGFYTLRLLVQCSYNLKDLEGIQLAVFICTAIAMILFLIPLALIVFFWTLWRFHQAMVLERKVHEDAFADMLNEHRERVLSSIRANQPEDARKATASLKILKELEPSRADYPVWPFNWMTLAKFSVPQFVAAISVVAPVVKIFFKSGS